MKDYSSKKKKSRVEQKEVKRYTAGFSIKTFSKGFLLFKMSNIFSCVCNIAQHFQHTCGELEHRTECRSEYFHQFESVSEMHSLKTLICAVVNQFLFLKPNSFN